jgi:hypothetical protein
MAISTDRDRVRLLIGDTDTNDQLFQDDEIAYFLELANNVILSAAAKACDAAAAKYSRAIKFQTDDQMFDPLARAGEMRAMAAQFRAQASGVTGVVPTKQDAYSSTIPADQFSGGGSGSRSGHGNYYTNRDRVF